MKDHVQPGDQRVARRGGGIGFGVLKNGRAAGRGSVRDDESREPPPTLQLPGEEVAILRCGHAVDGVVRRHDGARVPFLDCGFERRKMRLGKRAGVELDGIAVPPSLADVGHKVLRCGDDAAALERGHEDAGQFRGEVRIFPVGLLHASPADVGGDVDHGRQHLPDAAATRLARDRVRDTIDECSVPGRRQCDGCRKDRGAGARQAMDRFIEWNRGDAQARALDEVALNGVDALRMRSCCRGRIDAVGEGDGDLQAEDAVRVIV